VSTTAQKWDTEEAARLAREAYRYAARTYPIDADMEPLGVADRAVLEAREAGDWEAFVEALRGDKGGGRHLPHLPIKGAGRGDCDELLRGCWGAAASRLRAPPPVVCAPPSEAGSGGVVSFARVFAVYYTPPPSPTL
jgi:hypothetical protein